MLGDNPEKSKNPLKKAMRRRNAKTVQFAPPTYYEPSDYEYSDEEDEPEGDDARAEQAEVDTGDDNDPDDNKQDVAVTNIAEPQDTRGEPVATSNIRPVVSTESLKNDLTTNQVKSQQVVAESRDSEDSVSRSRKGNVRNTDSFFKDDTAETKKISLTPRLLRGDSDGPASADAEVRQRPSLETFDKMVGVDDKSKDKDRKEKKEKKGMLSGLFKRKKGAPPEETEKGPDDARQSPGSKDSSESLSRPETGPERKPSKLQKTPPVMSPKSSPTEPRGPQQALAPAPPAPTGPAPQPPVNRAENATLQPDAQLQPAQVNRFPSLTEKRSIFTSTQPKPTLIAVQQEPDVTKPVYSQRAKERFAIDESDSELEEEKPKAEGLLDIRGPSSNPQSVAHDKYGVHQPPPVEPAASHTPAEHTLQTQPAPTQSSSPLLQDVQAPESDGTVSTSKPSPSTATHTPSTSRSTPTWSDASLRTYMENSQDIKDLLIIVHDKSNVTPVGPDHPLMHDLFSNERTKLAEMQSQLDGMLMGWLSKKNGVMQATT
jgi:hypothetical protein